MQLAPHSLQWAQTTLLIVESETVTAISKDNERQVFFYHNAEMLRDALISWARQSAGAVTIRREWRFL
jgi:hypothetical protein